MKQIAAIPALTPPVLGDNMFALATNTGATRVIIPDRWKGGSLTIMSQGADTYTLERKPVVSARTLER